MPNRSRQPPAPARTAQVPAPGPEFAGREQELAWLTEHLDTDPILLIEGLPGAGKTSLLAALARELAATHRVVWVDCRGAELDSLLAAVGAARGEGTVLLADDLHRLGAEGAGTLLRAAAAAGHTTVLIAATRDLPALGPVELVLTAELLLEGLGESAGRSLLATLAGPALARAESHYALTGGNPAAIRLLASQAGRGLDPERLRTEVCREIGLTGLDALLSAASPGQLRTLEALAVLDTGQGVPLELLELVAGPRPPLEYALRRFLAVGGAGRYRIPEPIRTCVLTRLAPQDLTRWELEAGRAQQGRANWSEALGHFCRAGDGPAALGALRELAAVLGREGRHAELLEQIDSSSPVTADPELTVLRARALASCGRLREAIQAIRHERDRLASLPGGSRPRDEAMLLTCLAELHRQEGELQRSLRAAYDALHRSEQSGDPSSTVAALEVLSLLHADRGEHDKALSLLSRAQAVGTDGDSARFLAVRAAAEEQAGRQDSAIRLYRMALESATDASERARLMLSLAALTRLSGEQTTAAALAAEGLALARASGDATCTSRAQVLLAQLARGRGAADEALTHLNDALASAHGRESGADQLLALLERGEILQMRGDYRGASRDYGRAMALATDVAGGTAGERVLDSSVAVRALTLLGALAADRGEYARAAETYRQAMEAMRGGTGGQTIGVLLCGMASVSRGQGDYVTAAQLLEQAQRASSTGLTGTSAGTAPGRSLQGRVLLEKAALARVRGDYRAGLEHCASAQDLADHAGDRPLEARILIESATIFRENGEYAKSMDVLARGLPLCRVMGDRLGTALCLHELARCHQERGEYARASRLYRRGLMMAQRMDASQLVARFFNALAHIETDRGEYRTALTLYRRARLILRGLSDRKEVQRTLGGMADIYRNRREFDQALRLVEECLHLAGGLPDRPGVARALSQMAAIQHLMGRHVQALEHQSRSLALKEELGDVRGIVESLTRMARIHASLGDLDRAAPLVERGLKVAHEFGLARNEVLLMEERAACELGLGRLDSAESLTAEALTLASNLEFTDGLARGYRLMGLLEKRRNHYESSQKYLNRSLKQFKRLRRDVETEELLAELRSVSRENLEVLLKLREEMLANTARLEREILERYGKRTALLLAELPGCAGSLSEAQIEPTMELMQRQDEVLVPRLLCGGGTILRHVGDRVLARFGAPGPALDCALAIRSELGRLATAGDPDRLPLRMALHCGVVSEQSGTISGSVVEILGRLLRLADPDGIVLTGAVADECRGSLPVALEELPGQRSRSGETPLRVFRVVQEAP